MQERTHSTTNSGSTPRAQTPGSPFGPVRKWGQPKPAPQPKPGIPGQSKPSDLTARPLSAAAQAEVDAYYSGRTHPAQLELPLQRAHVALDLADMRSAA